MGNVATSLSSVAWSLQFLWEDQFQDVLMAQSLLGQSL